MDGTKLSVDEKYSLTINEAAQYFSIGIKKMRRMAEDNLGDFAVYNGKRYLIIRRKFKDYLARTSEI
jgi:excisionase family DNA binding protein